MDGPAGTRRTTSQPRVCPITTASQKIGLLQGRTVACASLATAVHLKRIFAGADSLRGGWLDQISSMLRQRPLRVLQYCGKDALCIQSLCLIDFHRLEGLGDLVWVITSVIQEYRGASAFEIVRKVLSSLQEMASLFSQQAVELNHVAL